MDIYRVPIEFPEFVQILHIPIQRYSPCDIYGHVPGKLTTDGYYCQSCGALISIPEFPTVSLYTSGDYA